jgi:membrane-bound inhibitor of C-type lysozyme
MRTLLKVGAAVAAGMVAGPAMAAPAPQPPMNSLNNAFYNCDDNAAFLMAYDKTRATTATMTTSNNNKQYMLKRAPVAMGVQFNGDTVKFWTDGDKVTVEGTEVTLTNCKLKPT